LSNNSEKKLTAGEIYDPVILALLEEETATKASLEQRAIAVVTTSGLLVSLLVAFAALGLGEDAHAMMTHGARFLLVLSAIPFVTAAIFAVLANAPRGYLSFDDRDIDRMVDDRDRDAAIAVEMLAEINSRRLKSALHSNSVKATLLRLAVGLEVAGISALALAVVIGLTMAP
jgi:hypothetical protein